MTECLPRLPIYLSNQFNYNTIQYRLFSAADGCSLARSPASSIVGLWSRNGLWTPRVSAAHYTISIEGGVCVQVELSKTKASYRHCQPAAAAAAKQNTLRGCCRRWISRIQLQFVGKHCTRCARDASHLDCIDTYLDKDGIYKRIKNAEKIRMSVSGSRGSGSGKWLTCYLNCRSN